MEEQLAALVAAQAATNTAMAEVYYFVTIPLMVLIHVGFLSYEMVLLDKKRSNFGIEKYPSIRFSGACILLCWLVFVLGSTNRNRFWRRAI